MNRVWIGIIGLGNMGTGHAMTLLGGGVPELLLTAVADGNEMRCNAILALPGASDVKAYASWEDFIGC